MTLPKDGQHVIIEVRETVYYRATYDEAGAVYRLEDWPATSFHERAVKNWTPTDWRNHNE